MIEYVDSGPDRAVMADRLQAVREHIRQTAQACGRQPDEITLIGVSKFFPPAYAAAAYGLGLPDLGENRVQELTAKVAALANQGLHPNWHLIGTLQKNKVKYIIGRTCLIHSIDSLDLLQEVGRRSLAAGLVSDVLLQVNISAELSKHGFEADGLAETARGALAVQGIRLRGLMTMAPLSEDPEDTLPIFTEAHQVFRYLAAQVVCQEGFDCLSMGMSHDYRQAIRCGSTHVRIGTAIFGPRSPMAT